MESYKDLEFDLIEADRVQTKDESDFENGNILRSINEILECFANKDVRNIELKIEELAKIIYLFREVNSFHNFFRQSELIGFLVNFIQMEFLNIPAKIEIIKIFDVVIDWYDDKEVENISKQSFLRNVYDILNLNFPTSYEDKNEIQTARLILHFFSKISIRTKQSRDSILNIFSNSNTISPFYPLFEMICAFSEIESVQDSLINLFSNFCYFELKPEIAPQVYNEYIIRLFDDNIVKSAFLWEELLKIIEIFLSNDYGKEICAREETFEILKVSISEGRGIETALKIMNIFVDLNCGIFNFLDFPFLCQNITNPDLNISVGILNLIEVLISQKRRDETEETIEQSNVYYIKFLFKNKLLFQLKKALELSLLQKVAALQVIYVLLEKGDLNVIREIIKAEIIPHLIELIEMHDFKISELVVDILFAIFCNCYETETEMTARALDQVNEFGENELNILLGETENNDLASNIEILLHKIFELRHREDIVFLVMGNSHSDDENQAFGQNQEEEELQVPFNQGIPNRRKMPVF